MRYNHAFSICFSIENEHPEGENLTAEQIRDAILQRVRRAYESNELHEAIDAPYDTYEVPVKYFRKEKTNAKTNP